MKIQDENTDQIYPSALLMNGKGPYDSSASSSYESFHVSKGEDETSCILKKHVMIYFARVLDHGFLVTTNRKDLPVQNLKRWDSFQFQLQD